jgi:hypothetical protein
MFWRVVITEGLRHDGELWWRPRHPRCAILALWVAESPAVSRWNRC